MGLGHARGVLDLHRGHFRFYFGGTAKAIVETCLMGGFSRDGRRQWPEQALLTLGISSWFIFLSFSLQVGTAVLVFSSE